MRMSRITLIIIFSFPLSLLTHEGADIVPQSRSRMPTEEPRALLSRSGDCKEELDYFTMLANSDPRVPFEELHIGALWAVEEMEGGKPFKGATAIERRFPTVKKADIEGNGKDARFVVKSLQSILDARLPQPCDAEGVEAYLRSRSSDADREALGPALAHIVQKYHWKLREDRALRKRSSEKQDSS